MEPCRFDRLAQGLVSSSSRRLALIGLLGGLAATAGESEAKKKKKKKCKPCQPQCDDKECGPNSCPTGDCGTCASGEVCNILGQCVECRVGTDCAPEACKIPTCVNEVCQYPNDMNNIPCLQGMGVCCDGECVIAMTCP